jgi:2,4-dienoyl-CoA reductase-like NADH-dependent reductase (Old Yellow Enzyme family)
MKTLFDKTQLQQMTLKNRFIRAAIHEKTADGQVTEHILKIYKELAQGGAGTVITGITLVDDVEKSFPMLAFYNDSFYESHKKLTNLMHEYNANIIMTGGNSDFKEMTEILNITKIEYFGMARTLAKEPDLINRFDASKENKGELLWKL